MKRILLIGTYSVESYYNRSRLLLRACAYIRERGSILYLGMAKEISKYHTDAPAGKRPKKLLPPKPSMQTE